MSRDTQPPATRTSVSRPPIVWLTVSLRRRERTSSWTAGITQRVIAKPPRAMWLPSETISSADFSEEPDEEPRPMCDEHLIPQVLGPEVGYRAHFHATVGGGAGEAATEEIMLGRTLTLERARQLNSRNFFYEMLKDNPSITAIHPGVEDELMDGAIDCHIHAYPDFVHRAQDMVQIAIDASRARMRAIAFKDHWNLTAGEAYLVQRYVDEMVRDGRLEHLVEVYGGLGLNHGINPEAVRIALQYPNFKLIWFPTFKSYGWARFAG